MAKAKSVISVVGSTSLLGREIVDVVKDTALPAETKLIGADDAEAGTLTSAAGEATVITPLDEENLEGSRVVFLAGSPESGRKAFQIATRAEHGPVVVDVTNVLEDHPSARLRAPLLEPPEFEVPASAVHVIAHPASIVLAIFLGRLHSKHPFKRAVVHIFEPASERGRRGIDELQRQTVNLLTFKTLPKEVFDEQLGFNMLSRYGSEAPQALEDIEKRIERHLATLLAMTGNVPMPSLRLIQAPVFHGYSFSIWAEFEENVTATEFGDALATTSIDVRGAELDPPTNVGMAGQSGMAVGSIARDDNDPRASWFWVVADNLRVAAENAVAVARALIGTGTGWVQ